MDQNVIIERCTSIEQPGWLDLRLAIWPEDSAEQHLEEMSASLGEPHRYVNFIAYSDARQPIGFAEASVRTDYVNGTESSPVAFLEGLYVVPDQRRKGVAAALVTAVSEWGRSAGCSELASDALLDNEISHAVHRSLGFSETKRVVYFRKELDRP